jgi:hypothetical protein
MTRNLADCFNKVLKGVRVFYVTVIVRYTFDRMNMYFLNYSDETNMEIAGMFKKNKHKYKYPPKIDESMEFQSRKAESQVATLFDNDELIYQVDDPGGTTADGVQHGGRAFKVSLKVCEGHNTRKCEQRKRPKGNEARNSRPAPGSPLNSKTTSQL